MFLKHNKCGRVVDVINTAVIEDTIFPIFQRRVDIAGMPIGIFSYEYQAKEHTLSSRLVSVPVGGFGIPGEIATCSNKVYTLYCVCRHFLFYLLLPNFKLTFTICCLMCFTSSPVNVLLADGINLLEVNAMKQEFFIFLAFIFLFHDMYVPVGNPYYINHLH